MPRPEKQDHRPHRLSVRVSAEELARFTERVRLAGVSPSDYLRQAALAGHMKTVKTAKADPELIAQINRIGVNLNQMTRTANGTGRVPPELVRMCEKIEQIIVRAVEQEVT